MTREIVENAAGTPEANIQGVTLRVPTHVAAPSHGLVLREGPRPTRPRGHIPRVARLLALAHHFQELLDTRAVETGPSSPSWLWCRDIQEEICPAVRNPGSRDGQR
jgi:hypothetical protein